MIGMLVSDWAVAVALTVLMGVVFSPLIVAVLVVSKRSSLFGPLLVGFSMTLLLWTLLGRFFVPRPQGRYALFMDEKKTEFNPEAVFIWPGERNRFEYRPMETSCKFNGSNTLQHIHFTIVAEAGVLYTDIEKALDVCKDLQGVEVSRWPVVVQEHLFSAAKGVVGLYDYTITTQKRWP